MKKGNKRNNYNDRDREFSGYDKKPAYNDRPRQQRNFREEVSKEATILRDVLIDQVKAFSEAMDAGSALEDAAKKLFYFSDYPTPIEGLEDYDVYQLERSVSVAKSNPSVLYSPSTILMVLNKVTHKPAFLAKVFMTWVPADMIYRTRIVIYEQGERGTIYNRTLRWSSTN